jgi:hypothetical protein
MQWAGKFSTFKDKLSCEHLNSLLRSYKFVFLSVGARVPLGNEALGNKLTQPQFLSDLVVLFDERKWAPSGAKKMKGVQLHKQ